MELRNPQEIRREQRSSPNRQSSTQSPKQIAPRARKCLNDEEIFPAPKTSARAFPPLSCGHGDAAGYAGLRGGRVDSQEYAIKVEPYYAPSRISRNDECDFPALQILPIPDSLISCEQYVESRPFCHCEQIAV